MLSVRTFAVLAVIAVASISSFADTNGKITGVVTDASGASVAGATVTATKIETAESVTTTTDSKGGFTLLALPPGHYKVEVRQEGFKAYEKNDIIVDVNSALQINVGLTVGSPTEKLLVQAETVAIDTVSTQVGDVIGDKAVETLPLNGRSYTDLLALQPGVVPVSACLGCTGTSFNPSTEEGNISINGQREDTNEFLVNGGIVNEARNNGTSTIPDLDSIAEFRIITNNVDAEYGYYSGGIVSVITKSGTDNFHGSAFDFLRNTDLDARNYYDVTRSVFQQNQFGGTVGGPIKRNKIFFFVDYQGTYSLEGLASGRVALPTVAERSGDLSADIAQLTGSVNGAYWATVLSNRLGYTVTSAESYYVPGCTKAPQCVFPGGVIPQAAFSSAAKGLLPSIPLPNEGGFFVGNNNQNTKDSRGGARVDIDTRLGRLSGYYFIDDSSALLPFGQNNIPGFPVENTGKPQQLNVSDTKTFGSATVNELRFNVLRTTFFSNQPTQGLGVKLSTLGFLENVPGGITAANPAYEGAPNITLNNFTTGLPALVYQRFQVTPQLSDNFSKVLGGHVLKFGGEYVNNVFHEIFPLANGNGTFGFSGSETGSDVADFLIGAPTFFLQVGSINYYSIKNYGGFYGQDSWRVRPNLTLNYGLRWDIIQNWYERKNQSSNTYIPGEQSVIFPSAPQGLVFAGDPRPGGGKIPRTVYNTPLDDFAPRIGIAYSPSASKGPLKWLIGGPGTTSLRAAYGLFYTNNSGVQIFQNIGTGPFLPVFSASFPALFEAPYTDRINGSVTPSPFPFTPPPPGSDKGFNWAAVEPIGVVPGYSIYDRTPYTEDYHATIERQLGSATVLSIAYVGTQGHALMDSMASNPGDAQLCVSLSAPSDVAPGTPTCGPFGENLTYTRANGTIVNGTRPRMGPLFSDNAYFATIGNSNYNSLQLSVHHSSGRLSFLAGYTYGKSIDDTSSVGDNYIELNPYNQRLSRELSAFDMAHYFVISYSYLLPFDTLGSQRWRWLSGGWQLSGITRFSTGLPIFLSEDDDRSFVGSIAQPMDLPDYNGAKLSFTNPRSDQPYFNIAAFSPEALGTIGNARRAFFTGPGINDFDLALMKGFKVNERINFEFRVEFFNLFNHAQFMNPSGNINSSEFGFVNSANDPRIGQASLHLRF